MIIIIVITVITTAKEVMLSPVCVCWFEGWGLRTTRYILVWMWIERLDPEFSFSFSLDGKMVIGMYTSHIHPFTHTFIYFYYML